MSNEELKIKEVHTFFYPCDSQAKCKPIVRYFSTGLYLFELYGAAGGTTSNEDKTFEGGKGGYTRAAIELTKRTKVYMYIGGKGTTSSNNLASGGWNGGGAGKVGEFLYEAAGGGGSTDIRFDCSLLSCRQLVAGGGGGAGTSAYEFIDTVGIAGHGGGLQGGDGSGYYVEGDQNKGEGGSQSGPGKGGNDTVLPRKVPDGSLLYGGSMEDVDNNIIFDSSCGGGGGGYYGGGAGAGTGGGGGSGYINDVFISIEGYEKETIDGGSDFPDVNGNFINGNPSSGIIKITSFSSYLIPLSFYQKQKISIKALLFITIFSKS